VEVVLLGCEAVFVVLFPVPWAAVGCCVVVAVEGGVHLVPDGVYLFFYSFEGGLVHCHGDVGSEESVVLCLCWEVDGED
jgi:hypothetical protein